MTNYNFSIQSDFVNHKVNTSKLASEIQGSTITVALDCINTEADLCSCIFKASLSESEVASLNTIVGQHTGEDEIVSALTYKTDTEGKIVIAEGPKIGLSLTLPSHNFCDPCSWYSICSLEDGDGYGEILTPRNGNQIFDSSHQYWIDLKHGRVTKEDDIVNRYPIKVFVNEEEKVEDEDYQINYQDGYVEFSSPLSSSDEVRAKYYYASSSSYVLCPPSGKKYRMLYTEVQFTKETKINSHVKFEIYVTNPYNPTGPKVRYNTGITEVYKNAKDFINVNNDGRVIPAFGEFENDIIILPFNYSTVVDIASTYGAELRISLGGDIPLNGQFATVTSYCLVEDL